MSTVFIALQCFQCSTMQVKQQKKSSNKWSCVVCNQKQSVRKVFAQGFMARDVRKFVQSFNMSRQLAEEKGTGETLALSPKEIDERFPSNHKKKRNDWSEYVDQEDNRDVKAQEEEEEEEGGNFESKIATELTKVLFNKPKLKNYSTGSDTGDHDEKPFRPVFSKRNTNKHIISQDKEPRKCQPTMAKGASKWGDYISQDNDALEVESRQEFTDYTDQRYPGVLETILNDQRVEVEVEEDIHPDFK